MNSKDPIQANVNIIKDKIKEMEEMLLSEDPQLPEYLKIIRDDLQQYPEVVYLLSPEEIAPVYKAVLNFANMQVQAKSSGRRKAGTLDSGAPVGSLL